MKRSYRNSLVEEKKKKNSKSHTSKKFTANRQKIQKKRISRAGMFNTSRKRLPGRNVRRISRPKTERKKKHFKLKNSKKKNQNSEKKLLLHTVYIKHKWKKQRMLMWKIRKQKWSMKKKTQLLIVVQWHENKKKGVNTNPKVSKPTINNKPDKRTRTKNTSRDSTKYSEV